METLTDTKSSSLQRSNKSKQAALTKAFAESLPPQKKLKPVPIRKEIVAFVTERNEAGRERMWRLELVTAGAVKVEGGGLYWLCTEPPADLDYDCPPACWNNDAPMKGKAKAKAWLLKQCRPGSPGSSDGWTTHEVIIGERNSLASDGTPDTIEP